MSETSYVPAFSLSDGLSFSGGFVSRNIQHLGTEKPAYELSVGSLTHADQAALYYSGLFEKYSIDTGISREAKEAAMAHYEAVHNNRGRGNWNHDGVDTDIDVKPLSRRRLPEGHEYVRWIKRPEWRQENGVWLPFEVEGSEAFVTEWPPDGYGPLPTTDGFRNPRTGWANATTPDRDKAVQEMAKEFEKYMDREPAQKLAEKEVSYSIRREHGRGKSALFRVFDLCDCGPFYEFADCDGGDRGGCLGSFPFCSSEEKK